MEGCLSEFIKKKQKTVLKWAKEYDALCNKNGIKCNPMIVLSFDRNYVSDIDCYDSKSDKLLAKTEFKFLKKEVD